MDEGHLPVMVEEVMTALSPSPGSFHIDGTVGGGGHTLRILEAASPDGRVLGLDADPRRWSARDTDWPATATGSCSVMPTSGASGRSPGAPASARSTASCWTSG